MSLLSAHELRKSFGPHAVLDGVNLTIDEGERLGLVGNNGSGKSTLARILGGVEAPDAGRVMKRRGARVATLTQVPDLNPEQTAFDAVAMGLLEWRELEARHSQISQLLAGSPENVASLLSEQAELATRIEQLGGWDLEHRVFAFLEHLSVPDPDARVGTLSGGEQRRVALAQQLLASPELLILDEPTNHLDTETSDWLEQYLATTFTGALLLITHDRYFLDRLVTRTVELSNGALTSYEGGWQQYLIGKAEREAIELRTEANRQNFLRTELEWLRRQPKARGTKQKARIDRAEQALADRPHTAEGSIHFELQAERQGSSILEFSSVRLAIGARVLIDDLTLTLHRRQRVGIIGRNGAGKTSLLRAVLGDLAPLAGRITRGKNTQIAYFDQTRSTLDDERSIAENVTDSPKVTYGDKELTLYSYLARFSFRSEEIHKKVSMLSGGERARVALAKLLLQKCNLLILDEPTNDLDVTTLSSLEELLQSFAGSVLVVTHDRYFLNRVATDILAFEGDGSVVHYVGNYDTYRSLRPETEKPRPSADGAGARAQSAPTPSKDTPSKDKRPLKLSYKEERELESMLEAIDALETSVAELEASLADPELYKREPSSAGELQRKLEAARTQLDGRVARWEELENKKAAFEASRA